MEGTPAYLFSESLLGPLFTNKDSMLPSPVVPGFLVSESLSIYKTRPKTIKGVRSEAKEPNDRNHTIKAMTLFLAVVFSLYLLPPLRVFVCLLFWFYIYCFP